jgi:hypothetical protein
MAGGLHPEPLSLEINYIQNGVRFALTSIGTIFANSKIEHEPKAILSTVHHAEAVPTNFGLKPESRCELLYSSQHIFQTDQVMLLPLASHDPTVHIQCDGALCQRISEYSCVFIPP